MAICNESGERNITLHFLSEPTPPTVDHAAPTLRATSSERIPGFNIVVPRDRFERMLVCIAAHCQEQLRSRTPRDVTSTFMYLILMLATECIHEEDRELLGLVTSMNPCIKVSSGRGWLIINYAPLGSPTQGKHIFCFGLGGEMHPVIKPAGLRILPNGDLYDETCHLLYPHMQAPYPLPWLQGVTRWQIEGRLHFLVSNFDTNPLHILCTQPPGEVREQATELYATLKAIVDDHVAELLRVNEGLHSARDEESEPCGFEEARLADLALKIKALACDRDGLVHTLLNHENPTHGLARQIQQLLTMIWQQAEQIADTHFQQRRRIEIACAVRRTQGELAPAGGGTIQQGSTTTAAC